MLRFITALVLLLIPSWAWAAITFDAASSAEGTTSTSHSHTIASDANIVVICVVMRDGGGAVEAITTAPTVGGQNASLVTGAVRTLTANNSRRVEMWYKLAPPTGSQTIAVTSPAVTDQTLTGVLSYKSVAQSSTWGTASVAEGGSNSDIDLFNIVSAVNEMGVMCGATQNAGTPATFTADANTPVSTERLDVAHSTGSTMSLGMYEETGTASNFDMRMNSSITSNWIAVASSMKPLAATTRASSSITIE